MRNLFNLDLLGTLGLNAKLLCNNVFIVFLTIFALQIF